MDIAFQFVANDIALDFVNTRVRAREGEVDLVDTPEQMTRWLNAAGLTADNAVWNWREMAAAAELRDAVRSLMQAVIGGDRPERDALDQINRNLSRYDLNWKLVLENGAYRLADRDAALTPDMVLGLLAKHAAELLASEESQRVRVCADPDCILMFKDTSKSGRRRWCSMQTCGNRAKATTFRTNAET